MENLNISLELDRIIENLAEIPSTKDYWLIRTQSGSLFDTFMEHGIVGLDHKELSLEHLNNIKNRELNEDSRLLEVKASVRRFYEQHQPDAEHTGNKLGLIAGQIFKMYFKVKAGDIVIIPSENSMQVSFGQVIESNITNTLGQGIDGILYKKVKWLQTINKYDLDPYIYKILTSHQAIVSVKSYAEVIERSLKQFFVLSNEAHLIINVNKRDRIKARELFGLGYNLTELIREYIEENNINDVDIDDLDLTINLNSPGKINFKSATKKVVIIALAIVALSGGGVKYTPQDGFSIDTKGLPALLSSISDFLDRRQDREIKEDLVATYKDSLEVQSPTDLINLLKQNDRNKDLPKGGTDSLRNNNE